LWASLQTTFFFSFQGKNWKKVAEKFEDRSDVQCLHRWQKVLNPELVKGPWTKEEDDKVIELVNKYGPKRWSLIANHLKGRIGKQCRERLVRNAHPFPTLSHFPPGGPPAALVSWLAFA
jgi:myb proto-oncogene protein